MKNNNDTERKGLEIDNLEMAAYRGLINRRQFIARLTQLGVSLGVAEAMASGADSAEKNRAPLRTEYDYIIVGAGSAGSLLANRLSSKGATVLLIEAGTDNINQPKNIDSTRWVENLGTDTDWAYPLEPQDNLNNRQLIISAGKIIGGSGSVNAMFWLRGDLRDYKQWHREVGANWKPSRMYRSFKRVESFKSGNNRFRGKRGPIKVRRYAQNNPLTGASIQGAQELGARSVDHNSSAYIDGAGVADVNILPNGRRSGPAQAYLLPALRHSRLTLLSDALVTDLVLEGSTCRGVNAIVDGQMQSFVAAREVILSAGAIGSARVLMQSGIGDANELNSAGVVVNHHLPNVGKNFQDHILLPGFNFNPGSELSSPTLGVVASFCFFRTNAMNQTPNIQLMCFQQILPFGGFPPGEGVAFLPSLSKPESRGSIKLTNADPTSTMKINPGYLRETSDMEAMLASFDYAMSIGFSNSMSTFVGGLNSTISTSMTRTEKIAYIRSNMLSGLHPVGTCSAGKNPQTSVVDSCFKVWGIDGLRVVDGSVLPSIPGVNPHAAILTIAELAANTLLSNRHR